MDDFIVSITTYPKRMDYFKKSFSHLHSIDSFDRIRKIIIVLDDNLSESEYEEYSKFLNSFDDNRIETLINDSKWRSANKLIPVYNKYGNEHNIICFDDDKFYPMECLTQILEEHERNSDCIVSQEINPIFISGDTTIGYINNLDIKLKQKEYGKYLSNACLFPKKCFGDGKLLNDYDKFKYVTNGNHDELWFWIVSTLNGVRSIGLDNTMGYIMDSNVVFDDDDTALTNINSSQTEVDGYNKRVSEVFGKELISVIKNGCVEFNVNKGNYFGVLYSIQQISYLYNGHKILFSVDKKLPESFLRILICAMGRVRWTNEIYMNRV